MRFSDFHPFTLLIYFSAIVTLTMITMNPLLLLLSFCGALFGAKMLKVKLSWGYLVFFLLIGLSNPIFSHNGETVLFYLFDLRVTFEAFFYGMVSGVLLVSVLIWFRIFSIVFTEDKLTYIVGKISQKLCVVFTMALRFVPLFTQNAKDIYDAQISMGIFNTKTLKGKFSLALNVFSALISMSVENAIETADTMRARGFENSKRSSYSLVLYSKNDLIFTFATLILTIIAICFFALGCGKFFYYPHISFPKFNLYFYLSFGLLAFLPVINEGKEAIKWKYLISKI